MSETRKKQAASVFGTLKSLFVGTNEEQAKTIAALTKDAHATVKRVRAREGAINAIGETVEPHADDVVAEAEDAPPVSRGRRP